MDQKDLGTREVVEGKPQKHLQDLKRYKRKKSEITDLNHY